MKKETRTNWSLLLKIALISLIVYNLIFIWGKFFNSFLTGFIAPVFNALQASLMAFTLFELIGIISIFVDLMGRWEKLGENKSMRKLRTVLVAVLIMAFIFKGFINYLDSAYLDS